VFTRRVCLSVCVLAEPGGKDEAGGPIRWRYLLRGVASAD